MLFNSIDFAIFMPIVFCLYWFLAKKNISIQNGFIVLASYFFYACWDWRFLFLILFSTLTDYVIGLLLKKENVERKRKILLVISIVVNLSFLGFFKYYNFFIENFVAVFQLFGQDLNIHTLNIILPVGISFYTFQTMSYTIDVYRRKMNPTGDFVAFAAFVAFFPQLVAGPIERATNFLPQFQKKRIFEYGTAVDGMRQILWGLFKKVIIADNCAILVNQVFADYTNYSGGTLLLAAIFFAFQIYGDFSGYSDIAIGTARLFGFNLMRNFNYPYFSRNIAEFWRKWHISLTTWFRDYVYIPLGGSKGGKGQVIRNTFIIFLLSGFWHGANWTFLAWGAFHALLFLPLILTNRNRKYTGEIAPNRLLPTCKELAQMILAFCFVVMGWIFFRAETLPDAFHYIGRIFSGTFFPFLVENQWINLVFILFMLIVEWIQRNHAHGYEFSRVKKRWIRYVIYILTVIVILWFMGSNEQFIYFQF